MRVPLLLTLFVAASFAAGDATSGHAEVTVQRVSSPSDAGAQGGAAEGPAGDAGDGESASNRLPLDAVRANILSTLSIASHCGAERLARGGAVTMCELGEEGGDTAASERWVSCLQDTFALRTGEVDDDEVARLAGKPLKGCPAERDAVLRIHARDLVSSVEAALGGSRCTDVVTIEKGDDAGGKAKKRGGAKKAAAGGDEPWSRAKDVEGATGTVVLVEGHAAVKPLKECRSRGSKITIPVVLLKSPACSEVAGDALEPYTIHEDGDLRRGGAACVDVKSVPSFVENWFSSLYDFKATKMTVLRHRESCCSSNGKKE